MKLLAGASNKRARKQGKRVKDPAETQFISNYKAKTLRVEELQQIKAETNSTGLYSNQRLDGPISKSKKRLLKRLEK
jgi:hypothetical protein